MKKRKTVDRLYLLLDRSYLIIIPSTDLL